MKLLSKHWSQQADIQLTEMGIAINMRRLSGAIAQLGERYNGIVEVGGSRPPSSTNNVPFV